MTRFIAILFLSLQLLTNTELCQLVKLPVLFEHYREHEALNKGISFFSFLNMHYFNSDPRDADYARDMQLPFKTNTGALLVCHSPSVPVSPAGFVLVPPKKEIPQHYIRHYFSRISSDNHNDIFQPPRFS